MGTYKLSVRRCLDILCSILVRLTSITDLSDSRSSLVTQAVGFVRALFPGIGIEVLQVYRFSFVVPHSGVILSRQDLRVIRATMTSNAGACTLSQDVSNFHSIRCDFKLLSDFCSCSGRPLPDMLLSGVALPHSWEHSCAPL